MHASRRYAAVLLIPLILCLERGAYYGTRSVVWGFLMDAGGMGASDIGTIFAVQQYLLAGMTILGGLLAIAAGPWPVLVLGLLTASAGYALVPALAEGPVQLPLYLTTVGVGLFRPAIWAAAILPFARPREAGRNGLCVLLWVGMNVAAFGSSFVGNAAYGQDAFGFVFVGAAVLTTFAALLSAGLGVGWLLTRKPPEVEAPPETTAGFDPMVTLVAGGLLLLLFLPWTGMMSVYSKLSRIFWDAPPNGWSPEIWNGINPLTVCWFGLLVAAIFLALSLLRRNVPTLLLIGLGLLLYGSALIGVSLEVVHTSGALLVGGVMLLSMGEVLAGPLILSRIGGDLHWRIATLAIAAWLAFSTLGYSIENIVMSAELLAEDSWIFQRSFAGLAIAAGIALLAAAIPLQRRLYSPDVPERPVDPRAVSAQPSASSFSSEVGQ